VRDERAAVDCQAFESSVSAVAGFAVLVKAG